MKSLKNRKFLYILTHPNIIHRLPISYPRFQAFRQIFWLVGQFCMFFLCVNILKYIVYSAKVLFCGFGHFCRIQLIFSVRFHCTVQFNIVIRAWTKSILSHYIFISIIINNKEKISWHAKKPRSRFNFSKRQK